MNGNAVSKVLFVLCSLILLFSMVLIYENSQLRAENREYKNKLILESLIIDVPQKECSQLGFCIGDYVELNNIAMGELNKTVRLNGTVVKISDSLITFDEGNEEWREFNEVWLRHYQISYYTWFNMNYTNVVDFNTTYIYIN